ncbi:PGF-CTERM sorting domain-containing protein [Methanoculleus sp.]|uniref:PGF-CTERM sorting domain-containing protein n=1 Tax=Methanoculleus sp. TaxID=90427 RepID=UPI001BD67477|nr:PGF-CTERM sorting domain-containing protein [Methanoculleus sp.]
MSNGIVLLALGLAVAMIVCSIPAGAVVTPLPGQGNQTGILFGVHPNAKTNETITAFIAEHGEIRWHESTYNHTHEYVYIVPANACEEQLVYLNKIRADEHGGEQSIEQIWIIGCDEAMPLAAELRFPEIFAKYPALSNDAELRSYIEYQSPNRYEVVTARPSRAQVYFINDTGVFTEYIVLLSGGEIVSTTYVSEENLTVGRAEAEAQALSGRSPDARVENVVLKVYGGDRIVWEVTVRAGRETEIVQVPSDLAPGQSLRTTTPGFGAVFAALGVGLSFALYRRRG